MPRLIPCLFLLLLGSCPLLASTTPDACADVIQAEHDRGQALLTGNLPALADLLSDDLDYTHSNGRKQTKQDVLADLKSGRSTYEHFALSDLAPRLIADGVVAVNGRIHQIKTKPNGRQEVKLLFLSVWRLEDESWRLVALQTVLPPPKP